MEKNRAKKSPKKDLMDKFVFFLQQNHPDFFIFKMNYLERKVFIENFFNCIEQEFFTALKSKKRIEIRDFGIWFSKKIEQREINNPIQDKKIIVSERLLPKFRPGKQLLEKLNAELNVEKSKDSKDKNKKFILKKYFKKIFSR